MFFFIIDLLNYFRLEIFVSIKILETCFEIVEIRLRTLIYSTRNILGILKINVSCFTCLFLTVRGKLNI